LAILVQIRQLFSQSRRLSSERDGKWEIEELCASSRNRTLQLLLKNPSDLKTFGALWDTFRMGPFGTPFGQGKSLRDGRWIFAVPALFRSKAFSAVRLSPERRFWKASELFRCRLFHTCTAMSAKIWVIFHPCRPESIWSMFLKQKV
jgi:hypothetical protein